MAMDRYKVTKIESGTAGAAKEHQENEQLRKETGKSDKNTLTKAFENYRKSGPKTEDRGPRTEDRGPKTENGERKTETRRTENGERKTENGVRTELRPTNQKSRVAHHDPRSTNPESRSTNHDPRSTNLQKSTFAQNVKTAAPILQDLLLKTPHPKAPPTVEQKKTEDRGPRTEDQKQPQHVDSQKGVVPPANPEGAKMASTTTGKDKGEVGKDGKEKKEPKKSDGAKSAQGKGGTQNAERSTQNGSLEAASSGIASDGGEPALVQGFNVESVADQNLILVMEGRHLFNTKIIKPRGEEVIATLERAAQLDKDPELERILGLRRPFPTDVNGGRRG